MQTHASVVNLLFNWHKQMYSIYYVYVHPTLFIKTIIFYNLKIQEFTEKNMRHTELFLSET